MYDVAIIGCGVIGAATAYALSRYENKVVILEAENDVADCTTKANSAILHAGYDPAPGTKMARLNVRGVELAKEICAKLDVPYKQCGSLVLALSESELPHLQHLYENGTANGVPDMKILTKEETLAMEPNLSENVCGALWAPSAAIVSPWEYALAMTEVAVRNGVELRRSCRVEDAEAMADGGYRLTTTQGTVEARYVINAAGIWAEKVHCMVEPASFHITPTRGEYYLLDKSEGTRVNHVIFQCPNELGKGVLVSPTVHGNLIVGPDAVPVHGDDTSCTSKGLEFVKATAQRSVPSINFGESIRNFAGVRANLDVDDFIIGEEPEAPGWIDLAGMKSPGLSAAPAVAEQLPVVGSLFSWLNRGGQDDYVSLQSEQLNKYAETVESTAETADSPYTLTLGQVFNDGDWLRISLMLTSEDDSLAGFNAIGPREDAVEKALQNGGGQYGTLVLDNGTELNGGVTFEKRDDRTFVTGINYELFLTHDDLAGHTATLTLSNLMACNKSIVETDGKSYWHYDYADQTPLPGTYTLTFTIPEVSDAGVRTMDTPVEQNGITLQSIKATPAATKVLLSFPAEQHWVSVKLYTADGTELGHERGEGGWWTDGAWTADPADFDHPEQCTKASYDYFAAVPENCHSLTVKVYDFDTDAELTTFTAELP